MSLCAAMAVPQQTRASASNVLAAPTPDRHNQLGAPPGHFVGLSYHSELYAFWWLLATTLRAQRAVANLVFSEQGQRNASSARIVELSANSCWSMGTYFFACMYLHVLELYSVLRSWHLHAKAFVIVWRPGTFMQLDGN